MLRCSEYLSRGGAGWDAGKVLRGKDLMFKAGGRLLRPEEVAISDQLTIFLRETKTDQYNEGQLLTHHRSDGNLPMCVVRAFRDVAMLFPERLTTEAELPFFRWEDNSPVTRDQVRKLLGTAAIRKGMPANVVNTHSLRAGGASALDFATGGNVQVVKRLGRWASEAFEGYLWEEASLTRGLASAMYRAPWGVHPAAF